MVVEMIKNGLCGNYFFWPFHLGLLGGVQA